MVASTHIHYLRVHRQLRNHKRWDLQSRYFKLCGPISVATAQLCIAQKQPHMTHRGARARTCKMNLHTHVHNHKNWVSHTRKTRVHNHKNPVTRVHKSSSSHIHTITQPGPHTHKCTMTTRDPHAQTSGAGSHLPSSLTDSRSPHAPPQEVARVPARPTRSRVTTRGGNGPQGLLGDVVWGLERRRAKDSGAVRSEKAQAISHPWPGATSLRPSSGSIRVRAGQIGVSAGRDPSTSRSGRGRPERRHVPEASGKCSLSSQCACVSACVTVRG